MERATKKTKYPAEHMAEVPHTKLLSRTTGNFYVRYSTPDTVTFKEGRKVSNDRLTLDAQVSESKIRAKYN